MSRSKSSSQWLKEHFKDEFVQKSWQDGYRSRAVYKLIEINEKDRLLKPGQVVVDLGAAPGGWSQYVIEKIGKKGKAIGLDILPVEGIEGLDFIQGDFSEDSVLETLQDKIRDFDGIDLVISDIAPNTSGIKAADQAKSMYLVELCYDFALGHLKPGGDFLCKVFQGRGFDELLVSARKEFKQVIIRKPKASRARSVETYLLARGKR